MEGSILCLTLSPCRVYSRSEVECERNNGRNNHRFSSIKCFAYGSWFLSMNPQMNGHIEVVTGFSGSNIQGTVATVCESFE